MVGMLGCGCCNNVGDLCNYGYGNNYPPPSTDADYYWSYVNAFSDYVEILPSEHKTKFVRDGKFWRYEENGLCIEQPPSFFAGKFYECEVKSPASILKTHDNNYRTNNFLFETDASVTENAAILGYSFDSPATGILPRNGNVYTTGCIHRLGNEGGSSNYAHGLLIKQFRTTVINTSQSLYGEPSLWYVIFQDGSFGAGGDPWWDLDGVLKILEKPIPWGSHRLGIGIETPTFGYTYGDTRYKNNFYLDGVKQYTLSEETSTIAQGEKPRFGGAVSNWFAYGCVTMISYFWEPRIIFNDLGIIGTGPELDRVYYRTNPINSRTFDEIAFTKYPKPQTRP